MSITKEYKQKVIGDFGMKPGDSGSPQVQIAILTNRISKLTSHMQENKKDFACRRGLLKMVSRRRRLLDYVKRTDPQLYLDLLRRLELRK